jgi:hypothetical protein
MAFDPAKVPRLPQGVENALREREAYFNPGIGQDEDGFTLQDAESLGWNVGLNHASKGFPGRGQVEVRSYEFGEGRYGVLKEIYDYELAEHQRARARARETYGRLVKAERQRLQAGNDPRKVIKCAREVLRISAELDEFGLLELPQEYIDELKNPSCSKAPRKERAT